MKKCNYLPYKFIISLYLFGKYKRQNFRMCFSLFHQKYSRSIEVSNIIFVKDANHWCGCFVQTETRFMLKIHLINAKLLGNIRAKFRKKSVVLYYFYDKKYGLITGHNWICSSRIVTTWALIGYHNAKLLYATASFCLYLIDSWQHG